MDPLMTLLSPTISLASCQELFSKYQPIAASLNWGDRGRESRYTYNFTGRITKRRKVCRKWKWKSLRLVKLFATPWTVACQAPLSMEFSRQEFWRGLPFPSQGDLPNPGIEPGSPALQADSLPLEYAERKSLKTRWISPWSYCPILSCRWVG